MDDSMNRSCPNILPTNDSASAQFLKRPRVHAILEMATKKQVVTIIAGTGYGKSLETLAFLKDRQPQSCWVTLTPMDNLSMHFWGHLLKGIAAVNKGASQHLSQLEFPEEDISFDSFCRILKDEIIGPQRFYFVIDDFFQLSTPSILRFFEKLALAPIPNLCLILISREELPINTVPLLSQDTLYSISEDALRLTQEEMSDFFKQQSITLSGKAESEFYAYTGGWVFATQLVSHALKKGVLYQKNPFSLVKLDIFSLLENDVFSIVSGDIQRLLIKMSLLGNVPTGLMQALAGHNPAQLTGLQKLGSFILYDRYNDIHRIHQIFQLFLAEKQGQLSQQETEEVYLQAAQWYEANGDKLDAISNYEKIHRYQQCANIILTFTSRYPVESVEFLIGVLNRMPAKLIQEMPILRVLYAKYLLNNLRFNEALLRLTEIGDEFESLPLTPETAEVLGEANIMLGFQHMMSGAFTREYDASLYFEKAYRYLPNGSRLNTGLRLLFGSYCCLLCSSDRGEAEKLIKDTQRMEFYCSKVLNGLGSGYSRLVEADDAFFKKDLNRAEKCLHQSLAKSRLYDQYDLENYAFFFLLRIYVATGKYPQAMAQLEQQRQLCQRINSTEGYAMHDLTTGWFYSQIEKPEKVPLWLRDAQKCKEIMSPITFGIDKLMRAKYLLAENKIYELLALCEEKSDNMAFETFLFQKIELGVLNAIALSKADETQKSAEALQEVYQLAAPNALIMPFVENGKHTRTLLNRIGKHCDIPQEWLTDIQTKATSYAKHLNHIVTNYNWAHLPENGRISLSKSEVKVLLSLAQGMTRNEIADECDLSVNTVKSIIQSIYSKLGVDNSFSAIRVATLMKLIE